MSASYYEYSLCFQSNSSHRVCISLCTMNTVYGTLNVHNNISDCSKQRKSVIADICVINGYRKVLNCVHIIHFAFIMV